MAVTPRIKAKVQVRVELEAMDPRDQQAIHQLLMQDSTGLMTRVDLNLGNVIVTSSMMCIVEGHVHFDAVVLGRIELTTPQESERQPASP